MLYQNLSILALISASLSIQASDELVQQYVNKKYSEADIKKRWMMIPGAKQTLELAAPKKNVLNKEWISEGIHVWLNGDSGIRGYYVAKKMAIDHESNNDIMPTITQYLDRCLRQQIDGKSVVQTIDTFEQQQ